MYYLFCRHNLLPGEYYRLPEGDKAAIRCFAGREIEDISQIREDRYGKGSVNRIYSKG